MNPSQLIRADRIEVMLLTRAVEKAAQHRLDLDKRLARLIVSELADALKRGRRH